MLVDPLRPVADPELGAIRQPQPLGVSASVAEGRLGSVDAKPGGFGPFVERGKQQRSRPRAEIEDALRARLSKNSTAAAISVSLSGRGTSAPGPTIRSMVQKARWPVI